MKLDHALAWVIRFFFKKTNNYSLTINFIMLGPEEMIR